MKIIQKEVIKEYTEDKTCYKMTVKYGFDVNFSKRNNQEPYFPLTKQSRMI